MTDNTNSKNIPFVSPQRHQYLGDTCDLLLDRSITGRMNPINVTADNEREVAGNKPQVGLPVSSVPHFLMTVEGAPTVTGGHWIASQEVQFKQFAVPCNGAYLPLVPPYNNGGPQPHIQYPVSIMEGPTLVPLHQQSFPVTNMSNTPYTINMFPNSYVAACMPLNPPVWNNVPALTSSTSRTINNNMLSPALQINLTPRSEGSSMANNTIRYETDHLSMSAAVNQPAGFVPINETKETLTRESPQIMEYGEVVGNAPRRLWSSMEIKCEQPGCPYVTHRPSLIRIHERYHRDIEQQQLVTGHKKKRYYFCQETDCGYIAADCSNFRVHRRKHTGVKPYHCKELGCGYSCNQLGNLRSHIQRAHPGHEETTNI